MMWRDVIQLVTATHSVNEYGDAVQTDTLVSAFANKKAIRQSEFYQAHATGLKPELMFEIRSVDYNEQQELIFNAKRYQVIRTYTKNDEIVELVCTGLVTGG